MEKPKIMTFGNVPSSSGTTLEWDKDQKYVLSESNNFITIGDPPYDPLVTTTATWTWPTKALLTIEEAQILKEAAKKDKKLAAVLRKMTPYIEVSFSLDAE